MCAFTDSSVKSVFLICIFGIQDSSLPCFAALGSQTAQQLKDRFQPSLSQSQIAEFVERLIMTSLGSHWTRLYDSVSALYCMEGLYVYAKESMFSSISIIHNLSYDHAHGTNILEFNNIGQAGCIVIIQ